MNQSFPFPIEFIRDCFRIPYWGFEGKDLPLGLKVVFSGGAGYTKMPMFLVAKGDSNDIFISIRGSTTIDDFVRDARLNTNRAMGGDVHEGALEAARWVITQVRKYINECKGRIFVVGHSLGAAVSSVISALLRIEEGRNNVYGIVAASFPVFSRNIAERTRSFITMFVHNNDIVPKLTAKNITKFINTLIETGRFGSWEQISTVLASSIQLILIGRGINDFQLFDQLPSILLNIRNLQGTNDLFLPGVIYNLERNSPYDQIYNCVPYAKEGQGFGDLPSVVGGIKDHSLEMIITALTIVMNRMRLSRTGPSDIDCLD